MPIAIEQAGLRRLLKRVEEARRRTDELFDILVPSALYDRPIAERHRIIFYIGHLEAFDWNLLSERLFGLRAFDPAFDKLFAFGIDPVDGGLPTDQPMDWPAIEQVRAYVGRVRGGIDERLADFDLSDTEQRTGEDWSAFTLLSVAIEHRLMHAETLAYMFHQLPYDKKIARASAFHAIESPLVSRMIDIPVGAATLGQSREPEVFGWDNEYDEHSVEVPVFAIDNHMVTNGQYLSFMEAGGYESREFWNDADWAWRESAQIKAPAFWRTADDGWRYRGMFEETALPMESPVYVSHAEASAYARWAGKSLPTEAQWHRAAYGTRQGVERLYPWGGVEPDPRKGNFDFAYWDPVPVAAFPEGASAFGIYQMLGNGWEWTASEFQPFAGFKPFSFYEGYSANFFDGKHYVIKGGSARTAACMLRRSFRNWFQPHYQYVYAGFRCVSN